MTVGAIIGIVIITLIAIVLIIGGIILLNDDDKRYGIATIIITVIVAGAIITGICFWQFNTESGKRALKTQESNFDGGIERTVSIYDVNGELIKEYTGKFDVETNGEERKILFDDEEGKRHIVYYTTGTICIDEN